MNKKIKKQGLIISCFLIMAGVVGMRNVFTLTLPDICSEFGFSRTEFGMTTTLHNLAAMALALVYPLMFTRMSQKRLVLITGALFGTGFIVMSFCSKMWQFNLCYGIMGALNTLCATTPITLMVSSAFKNDFGKILGICLSGSGFGGMLFSAVLGRVLELYGWRPALILSGFLTLLCIFPLSPIFLKDPDEKIHEKKRKSTELLNSHDKNEKNFVATPSFIVLFTACCVISAAFTVIIQCIPLHTDALGYPISVGSICMSVCMACVIASKIILGKTNDTLGCKTTYIYSIILGVVGFGALLSLSYDMPLIPAAIIFCPCAAISGSIATVSWPVIARKRFGLSNLAKSSSYFNVAVGLGSAICSVIHGKIYDATKSYDLVFILFALLSIISLICSVYFVPAKHKKSEIPS